MASQAQKEFVNKGPRERVPATSTFDKTVVAHDTSSSGRYKRDRTPDTFVRAPARDARAKAEAAKKAKARTTEAAQRETAEVRQSETAAADAKPEPRKRQAKKNT